MRKQRTDAVLVLRLMRKHELDLVILLVYGVITLDLHRPKRIDVSPYSITQLQIVTGVGYDCHNRNGGQGFLPDLQINLPIRDSTLTRCCTKKSPPRPKTPRATQSNLQLPLWLLAWRMQNAEAVSAIRPH